MRFGKTKSEQQLRSAIILAGGEGTRLRPMTSKISGDNRPKQFCAVVSRETLPGTDAVVVTRAHQRFYSPLLAKMRLEIGACSDRCPNGDAKIEAKDGSWKLRARLFRPLLLLSFLSLAGSVPALAEDTQAAPVAAASPTAALSPSAAATGLVKYVGSQVCKACHAEQAKKFSQTMMGKVLLLHARDEEERLGCEGCHGPGSLYIKDMTAAMGKGRKPNEVGTGPAGGGLVTFRKDAESAETQNRACLNCHEKGDRAFWRASMHAFRGIRCVDCHTVMSPVTASEQPNPQIGKSPLSVNFVNPFVVTSNETQVCLRCHLKEKMEINLPSHMPLREGLMVCSDCHNPHGGPYPKQLKAATVNEVCYRCHAEKRGPFLWIHAPVMMNCLDCHSPHGSVNLHMLTIRPPLLCQRCHIGMDHASSPQRPVSIFVFNQSCTNCHSQIHGSNSPGGRLFTR